MRHTWLFIISCGFVGGFFNCGMVKKRQECGQLVEKINVAVPQVESTLASANANPTSENIKVIAEGFAGLTKDIRAMEISTVELKTYADEYTKMTEEAAKIAYQMAEALKAENIEQFNLATEELAQVIQREDGIIDSLNTFCTGSKD